MAVVHQDLLVVGDDAVWLVSVPLEGQLGTRRNIWHIGLDLRFRNNPSPGFDRWQDLFGEVVAKICFVTLMCFLSSNSSFDISRLP